MITPESKGIATATGKSHLPWTPLFTGAAKNALNTGTRRILAAMRRPNAHFSRRDPRKRAIVAKPTNKPPQIT